MFLEREDLAPDTADQDGATPLSWAAKLGNADIVNIFLERGGVAPDARDKNGQTPLSWATARGHIRVVEMLLERCGGNQYIPTTGLAGQTALTQTPGRQHGVAIRRRLGDQDSVPQSVDSNSSIDLSPAESSQGPSKRIRLFRNSQQRFFTR